MECAYTGMMSFGFSSKDEFPIQYKTLTELEKQIPTECKSDFYIEKILHARFSMWSSLEDILVFLKYSPLSRTTHTGSLPNTQQTSRSSCRRHTWNWTVGCPPSNGVRGGRWTNPCLEHRWHSPCNPPRQSLDIPRGQSTHRLGERRGGGRGGKMNG